MSIKPWQAILLPVLIVLGIPTYAAIDGQLGATSTASININLTVLPRIQIKQLEDFQMTVTEDTNPASVQQIKTGCVVTNTQSGYYTLSATNTNGQASNGDYQMQNGKGMRVNYNISAGNMGGNLQSITSHSVRLKADNNSADCASGHNLQLKVQLAQTAHLTPGQYGDVVQLEVVPV
jgi:hypothetical protein